MHTALCAFHDRATAERARDELIRAGFARHDVHLQHSGNGNHGSDGREDGTRQEMLRERGGVEHEIALDPHVVSRVTGFFGHLFGHGHPHRETWDGHVDSGRTVVVVDAHDEAEAQRANVLMKGLDSADSNVVHRPEQRPVRDIVADTPMSGTGPLSTQPMAPTRTESRSERATASTGTWPDRNRREEDRAVAGGEQRPLDLGTADDSDKVGLRYADKGDADKPAISRDGLGRTRNDD